MSSRRILFVVPTLDRSGAEKQLTLLAEGLAARGRFDVEVVALVRGGPYAERLAAAGLRVTVLGKRWRFDPSNLWRLRRVIRDRDPDVVNSWLFTANASTRLVTGGRNRPRVVVSERCVDSWKSGWQLWLDRRQVGRTDHLVGNSAAVVDFYRNLGYPAERTSVVHNGIVIPEPSGTERDAIRAELGLPPEARLVGYVGRLARQKRVRDLVWAMQLLQQITGDVHLVVAGDGPERERLEELARHYGCDRLVHFVGHREETVRLFAALDVFWLASDFEGLSNSAMEAMAAGVPVVASDIGPNRELVVDGETGHLVPVGDATEFAKRTRDLLEDPSRARAMGAAGRARMQAGFSVGKMVDSYADLFDRVCG